VGAQFVLDRLRRDHAICVGDAQFRGQGVPTGGIVERPALAPDEVEYAGDRRALAAQRNGEPQRAQRT